MEYSPPPRCDDTEEEQLLLVSRQIAGVVGVLAALDAAAEDELANGAVGADVIVA